MNGSDPFTIMRKAKIEEANRAKQQVLERKETTIIDSQPEQPESSFWYRLISSVKKFFS